MLFDTRFDSHHDYMDDDMDYDYECGCNRQDYTPGVMPMQQYPTCPTPAGPPVVHPPQIRCMTRQFVQEVPHICPVHTQITNQHICRHTYRPSYTCGEQNQVCHIHEGSCNQF